MLKRLTRQISLSLRLKLAMSFILLPTAGVIAFLLVSLFDYTSQYTAIIRNVTVASEFNFDFKKVIDYKMYQCIINGGKEAPEFDTSEDIRAARTVVKKLRETTVKQQSVDSIDKLDHFLTNLETGIVLLKETKGYDNKIDLLYMNLHGITELIQDTLHQYIYHEVANLAVMQAKTTKKVQTAIYYIVIGSAVCIISLWAFSMFLANSITRPIKELCRSTQMVGEGDFSIYPVESSNDEIQTLSDSFSHMVKRVGTLVEDVKLEQINLRKTELRLLQVQINPHFLYNTLDTVVWLAEGGRNQEVKSVITSLSAFLRTTLNGGKDFISLREEKRHITSYLEIQETRYGDILQYVIDIPDCLNDYAILKLTLQPLIENALYHGIKNKRGKGTITISGYLEADEIHLTVRDNGIGMTPEQLDLLFIQKDHDKGFGLKNVRDRLRLNYGEGYGLHIESSLGEGTLASLVIPAQEIQPNS